MAVAIDAELLAADTLEYLKVKGETCDERDASLFFAQLCRRFGWEPWIDPVVDDRPNVYVRIPGTDPTAPGLLFNGHTDTIPIGDSKPPARDGDWLIGRGAEDMRGGLVAMAHAAAALQQAGIRLPGDLWLTAVIDHETPHGSKRGPRRLIERIREGSIQTKAIVIVEGPAAIWAASLGSTIYKVTITSPRGIVHTIKVPYRENPACWLGRLLVEFEQLEKRFAVQPGHPLCGPERVNVGCITAGDWMNRLPTPIEVSGTWRWPPGKTFQEVKGLLESICARLAEQSGLSLKAEFLGNREPFETAASHPIVRAFQSAGEELLGKAPPMIGMGLVGDANLYFNEAGVPTVYYGPAHETAHSDFERVSIRQLAHCAGMYALAAERYYRSGW